MERKKTLLFSDAIKVSAPKAFNVMAKPAGPKCNLNCSYCYYLDKARFYPASSENRMNDLVLEKFIIEYITAQEVPVVTFTWQGGEPSLAGLDFFRKVVELQDKYAGNKRIENSFQTNGTRLTDEWCSFFAERNFLVGISVDGEEHNHDHYRMTASGRPTFSQVMKSIELLHKHRVEFNTLSTINSYNYRFAAETYRFLKKIGSGFIQFLPVVERMNNYGFDTDRQIVPPSFSGDAVVTPWSVTGEQYGEFLITIFDEWVRKDVASYYVQIFDSTLANYVGEMPGVCVFSETCGDAMVIEQNGDLYSCDHYVFPDYLLGNINEQSLSELAGLQRQFDFGISKRSSLPKQCLRCEVRYACHGECPKHRILTTSEGEAGLNYLCEGYRKFFRHAEPYMEFMAKELNNKRPPANVMNWIRNRENIYVKPSLPGRNDPCPCGSGKKFKNCCASKSLLIS